jgi:anti-sigma factor RsiW
MLSDYIDGSLSEPEKQELERYLRDHPSGREELAQLEFIKHLP